MALIRASEMNESLEDKLAPEGLYELRIAKADWNETAKTKEGKDNRHVLALMLTIEGEDGVGISPVNLYLTEATETDDARMRRMRNRDWKRLFKTFGVPLDQDFDPEEHVGDLVGLVGKAKVIQEEIKEGPRAGEMTNCVVLPKAD